MGMLLCLLHEFSLNFLGPSNLEEQIPASAKGRFGVTGGPYFFRSVKTF
jgi:hypothetical protein